MDSAVGNFDRADVLIEDDVISAIAPRLEIADAIVIDASDMIVMPGFVDSHRHAWEGQLRRIAPNSPSLTDYLNSTHYSLATHYRPQDMYVGNLLTALGALDSGITTIVDNSHNTRSEAHATAAIDALEDAGIRAVYAPGAPLAGDWDRRCWPGLLSNLQSNRFSGSCGLVTLAMMSQWNLENWTIARRLGLRIITEFLGADMGELLPQLMQDGHLGPDNIFNHNTGLTDSQWRILHDAGVQINVCPRSDAQYGLEEGVHTFHRAVQHGISPAISIDVEASYGGDMFAEMRVAFFIQRSHLQHLRHVGAKTAAEPIGVEDVLRSATLNGARVAGIDAITGSLTPGKQADIILIRAGDLNIFPSNHAVGSIVHAADRSNVDTVIVGGRIRKASGTLLGVDLPALRAAAHASRDGLFARAGFLPDQFATSSPQFS